MARTIKRRDPTRPAFWYVGFRHPHPPLVPLQSYLDMYRDVSIDLPYQGSWTTGEEADQPFAIASALGTTRLLSEQDILEARRAFYALCTHIDHQVRWLIGTLLQEGVLDRTIIVFLSDHGDMIGNHGIVAKRMFYEYSANVPLIISAPKSMVQVAPGSVDERVMGLQDVMPSLLDLCGLDVPDSVDGRSALGRINGLPSRVVVGIAYAPIFGGQQDMHVAG